MYRVQARPQLGRTFSAEHSFFYFHNWKFNRADYRTWEKKSEFNSINRGSWRHRKRSTHNLAALASLAASIFAMAGCGGVVVNGKTSTPNATLVATPSSLDFGAVAIGDSANQKVTIANTGAGTAEITALNVSGGGFSVNGLGALPLNLTAGGSLSFDVHFAPKDTAAATGQLSIITGSSSTPATTVALEGKGSSAIAPTLAGLSCANSSITGAEQDTCTVTLTSAAPSGGLAVSLSSSSSAIAIPASVKVAAAATTASFVANVSAVTASQTVTLTATQGSVSKPISIKLNSKSTSSLVTPSVSAVSCASNSFSGSGTTNCTVSLTSAAAVGGVGVILESSTSAVAVPASVTVAAGASTASFNATVAAVSTSETATITANANSSSRSFALQLTAGTAALSANATSISFGSTALNTPTTQSLKLTATGSASVTINAVSVTGAGFSVSGATFPLTLTPGQSVSLDLQFDPTTAGAATGQLTISNSSSNATIAISLSGTATSHKVSLNWDPPTTGTDPIAGYNVYRTTGGTTAYQRVNSAPDAATTYSDTTVQSGQTYDYVVKTVDTSGNESVPSNVTTVTVP